MKNSTDIEINKPAQRLSIRKRIARQRRRLALRIRRFTSSKFHMSLVREHASRRNEILFHPAYTERWTDSKIALPEITISIVIYNSEKWLENYFKSLLLQNYTLSKICLSIVDNGSSDNSVQLVEDFIKSNKYKFLSIELQKSSNVGFGLGHNMACRNVSTEYVLISNVDLELPLIHI